MVYTINLKRFSVLCLILCLSLITWAQKTYQPKFSDPLHEPWRWKLIPELRGKGIRCISETNDTSAWFGTDDAVYKYNGLEWTEFNAKNSCIKPPVNIFFHSDKGILYAGSDKGIYMYSNNNWSVVFESPENVTINTSFIKTVKNGSLIAGISQGLLYINNNQKIIFSTELIAKPLLKKYANLRLIKLPSDILIDNQFPHFDDAFEFTPDDFWILLSNPPAGTILSFNLVNALSEGEMDYKIQKDLLGHKLSARQKMMRTSTGEIWLISAHYSSKIFIFKNNKWNYLKLSQIFGGDDLHTSILETSDSSIWIGSIAKVFVYKNNKWNSYEAPNYPIPYSRILLYKSKRGPIWVAGLQNEVYYLNYSKKIWTTYKNLNFECETDDGTKWFLSSDSKVVYNKKDKWYYYDASDSIIDAPVKIIATKNGTIWISGSHKGVAATAYLSGNRWYKQVHPQLSWGVDYRSVYEAEDGSMWFGASVDALVDKGHKAGILHLEAENDGKQKWTHYHTAHGISQMNCYGVGQSVNGTVFIGGTSLLQFNGEKWNNNTLPSQLKMLVNCIYNKPGQKMWVGSRFYGLFAFDGKNWEHFSTEHGLASNSIISIYAVNDSTVWVATDNGICRYDGKSWHTSFIHPQLTLTREGGAILVGKDGAIWINKSLREWKRRAFPYNIIAPIAYDNFYSVRYFPDNLAPDTKIKVFSEKIDNSGNTVISWEGIDYWDDTPANQLAFSYRLNNSEWSDFKNINYQTFTNLTDGEYIFEVRARDFDFNVDKSPARIQFIVTPPVWKQTWFILLVLGFLAAISYSVLQILRRNKKLAYLNNNLNNKNLQLSQQKEEIVIQQNKILEQKSQLEYSNALLENQNLEISNQRDKLQEMVYQIEELSRTKLNFFTNVSHEFRTPLTLLLGPIERLLQKDEPDYLKRHEIYNLIFQNAKRLLRLINQLLEFRKIESGKIKLLLNTGNLTQTISDVFNAFQTMAQQKNINYQLTTSHPELICVYDIDKIEKIIENLLSNAFKYTSIGGTIKLEIDKLKHKNQSNKRISGINGFYIQIKVSDSGKGILPEEIAHIFERFFQSKDKTKINVISSGLGLSYIKELVEIHNGSINVQSEHGIGSVFTFNLPYLEKSNNLETNPLIVSDKTQIVSFENFGADNNQTTNDSADNKIESLNKTLETIDNVNNETVLIVEDDPDLLKYLNDLLKDYNTLVASNGDDGWIKATEYQPDIIISDVMMPGIGGIELCKNVKANLITSHIPVILLTARALIEHKIEGIETGADAYLEKPFNERLLLASVKNLIENRKRIREKFRKELVLNVDEMQISSADEKLIKNVIQLIEKNISEPEFNIDEMCKNFYLSRSHFSRKIKQITSLSPIELLVSYRLKHAAALILQKKLPISEIAYRVGFEHPNSLSRAFKKEFGMSPTEYAEKK